MTSNIHCFRVQRSESAREAAGLLGRVRRAASEVQIQSASLLALTWPWNKAPWQVHLELWERSRQQAEQLWQAFHRLQAIRDRMPIWQQDSVGTMKPHVQALVMGIGLAFQYVDEGMDNLAGPAYSSLIRTVYDGSVWLRELTDKAHEDLTDSVGNEERTEDQVRLALA